MIATPNRIATIQEEIDQLQLAIAELQESNLPQDKLKSSLEELETKRIACSAYLFCSEGDRVADRETGEVGMLTEKVEYLPGGTPPQVVVQFPDRLQRIDPSKLIVVVSEEESDIEEETHFLELAEEIEEEGIFVDETEPEVEETDEVASTTETKAEIPNLRFEEPDWSEIDLESLDEFGQLYASYKLKDPQGILLAKAPVGTYFILGRDAEKWKYYTGTMLNKRRFGEVKLRSTQMSPEKAKEMLTTRREIVINGKKTFAPNVVDQIKVVLGKVKGRNLETNIYNAKDFGGFRTTEITLAKGQNPPIVASVLAFSDRLSAYKIPAYEKVELEYETTNKVKQWGSNRYFEKNKIYCLPDAASFTKAEELLIIYGAALENLESKLRTLVRYEEELIAARKAGETLNPICPLAVKVDPLELADPNNKWNVNVWAQPLCNQLEVLKETKRQIKVRSFFKGEELHYPVNLSEPYLFAIDLETWERLEHCKQEIEIVAQNLERFLTQELRTYDSYENQGKQEVVAASQTPDETKTQENAIALTPNVNSMWLEIQAYIRNQQEDDLRIGLRFLDIRRELDSPEAFGQFIRKIVAPEWGLSEDAAIKKIQRRENIARVFGAMLNEEGSNAEEVFEILNRFPKTVLQIICAPRVPIVAREKAISQAKEGVKFSVESITALIEEHKNPLPGGSDKQPEKTVTVVVDSAEIDKLKKQYETEIEQLKIAAKKAESYKQENLELKAEVKKYEDMMKQFTQVSKGVGLSREIKEKIPPDTANEIENSLRFMVNRISDLEANLKGLREERDSLRQLIEEDAN